VPGSPLAALLFVAAAAPIGQAPIYQSAFMGFQAWQPQPPLDWRHLNDEMSRLGGHAGHLRASSPKSSPTSAPTTAPTATESPTGHQHPRAATKAPR
jgi:hypothetical protein